MKKIRVCSSRQRKLSSEREKNENEYLRMKLPADVRDSSFADFLAYQKYKRGENIIYRRIKEAWISRNPQELNF